MSLIKKKDLPMQRIDAAGGVLYRNSTGMVEVLLIFRRGVWDLPKGKREDYESFESCAVREVAEEVGLDAPYAELYLTDTYHEYEEGGNRIGKTTKWYSMKLLNQDGVPKPQAEEGITDLMWVTLSEAKNKVEFDNLVQVLNAFEKKTQPF